MSPPGSLAVSAVCVCVCVRARVRVHLADAFIQSDL